MTTFSKHFIMFAMLLMSLKMSSHLAYADKICSNPPPGVAKMVRGVDITTLDLIPMNSDDYHSSKSKILNLTCNLNNSWSSPSGVKYQLPDQIWAMESHPGGWMSARVDIVKTLTDVQTWRNKNSGIQGSILKSFFAGSHSYKTMQHTIMESSRMVADVSAFESATRVDFAPYWQLQMDRLAHMSLDRLLTGTFESNRSKYKQFIQQFGTHYFSTASFGGFYRVYMEIDKTYANSRTDREIKKNARAVFLEIISGKGADVSGSTSVSKSFRKATVHHVKYYGGDTNLLIADGIQKWQPTVDSDPWLFAGKIEPISNLITSETKKANLIKAVDDHVFRSSLDGMLASVQVVRKKVGSNPILQHLEKKIGKMQDKATLIKSEVEDLDEEVMEQLLWILSLKPPPHTTKAPKAPKKPASGAIKYVVNRVFLVALALAIPFFLI